jgi:hypothetical protein
MSTQSTDDLLAAINRARAVQAKHPPASAEWQSALQQLAALFEDMRYRTNAALGSAFSATLIGVSQRDLDVTVTVGERLLAELRKRGFAVFPRGAVPPRDVQG